MSKSLLFAAALLLFSCHPALAAPPPAGKITEVSGSVVLSHPGENVQSIKLNDVVNSGDVIRTADDGRVKISFIDGTEMVVAKKGFLAIDKYVFDPAKADEGKAKYRVIGAAFDFLGGKMDKGADSDVTIGLNFGSIGVRGTHIIRTMKNNECWIYLEKGKIDVFNKGGKVSLNPGEGTIMRAKTTAPDVPHIWTAKEISWIKGTVAKKGG